MRRKFNWVSTTIAAVVASSMVIGSTVVAQSSDSASSPTVNDRTSSGVVSDTSSLPAQGHGNTPAGSSPSGSTRAMNPAHSRSGVVTSPADDDASSRATSSRKAARATRPDRN